MGGCSEVVEVHHSGSTGEYTHAPSIISFASHVTDFFRLVDREAASAAFDVEASGQISR